MIRKCLLTLFVVCLYSGSLPAQGQQAEQMETKVYEVKWRNADDLAEMLMPFTRRPAEMTYHKTFRTITITAAPSVHTVIAEMIRKYDQPPNELEFQFYLLRAFRSGEGVKNGVPEHVRAVLKDISSLTAYKAFDLLESPVIRTTEAKPVAIETLGDLRGYIGLSPPFVIVPETGKPEIRIDTFELRFETMVTTQTVATKEGETRSSFQFKPTQLRTSFRIGDGETIVIGSSRVQTADKSAGDAIIAVVTARILTPSGSVAKK